MTNIITGFTLNSGVPIDNRYVVGPGKPWVNKNDITHKYDGLRIWDLNDNLPYVWLSGVWQSETTGSVSTSNGLLNYITKFTNNTNIITKSLIYDDGTKVGIGITSSNAATTNGLHVAGSIRTNNTFYGNGSGITNITATNITNGSLNIGRVASPATPTNKILLLSSYNGAKSWSVLESLTIGNAENANNLNVSTLNANFNNYLTFVSNTGQVPFYVNSGIKYNSFSNQLYLGLGTPMQPTYSFDSNVTSGLYYVSNSISTSIGGVRRFSVDANGSKTVNGSATNPSVSFLNSTSTGLYFDNALSISISGDKKAQFKDYGIQLRAGTATETSYSFIASTNTGMSMLSNDLIFNRNGVRGLELLTDSVNTYGTLITKNNTVLGSTQANNILLRKLTGFTNNDFNINEWIVRDTNGSDWLTTKYHNGISIDGSFNSPNTATPAGTRTYWERNPFIDEQYFGSYDKHVLTMKSIASGSYVYVNGFLKVNRSNNTSGDTQGICIGDVSTFSDSGSVYKNNFGMGSYHPNLLDLTKYGTYLSGKHGVEFITNNTTRMTILENGNIGIGTKTPGDDAKLAIVSSTQGIKIPIVTTTNRNAISSVSNGLLLFNDTNKSLESYNGAQSKWETYNKAPLLRSSVTIYFEDSDTSNILLTSIGVSSASSYTSANNTIIYVTLDDNILTSNSMINIYIQSTDIIHQTFYAPFYRYLANNYFTIYLDSTSVNYGAEFKIHFEIY